MYRKSLSGLALLYLVFLFSFLCVEEIWQNRQACAAADQAVTTITLEGIEAGCVADVPVKVRGETSTLGIVSYAISRQRVVDVLELEQKQAAKQAVVSGKSAEIGRDDPGKGKVELTADEVEILLRIVEAEAGNQDVEGRLLVANVVLNRVENDKFPDNVTDVVMQKNSKGRYQFSPVGSGRIWRVKISEKTNEAVGRALEGEDISEGALYFAARKYADSGSMRWFDEHLTYLFEHGGHEFYR